MKKQIPQVFLRVSEGDGNSSQLDFGNLADNSSEAEKVVPVCSPIPVDSVIKIHPAPCPICDWDPPNHNPNFRCGRGRK